MINETTKLKVTRNGDSADLHTIAQIVSKRLKVEKTSVLRPGLEARMVENRLGYIPAEYTVDAWKLSAV